ncbi:MAG TPA: 6-phosphogluconolactonase [Phycisphaerae bacterium]|nr:6-phosphogluconolactonase [Phycisphaerae bacterium]
MESEYCDKNGAAMTKEEVNALPADALAERSGIPLKVFPDTDPLYDAVAEVMIETVLAAPDGRATMILPVGPIGQYPVFARKVRDRNIDCRNLRTFHMDEFVDRNGRTVPEDHPMSFKGIILKHLFTQIPAKLRMPIEQLHFPRLDNMDEIDRAFDEHAPDGVDLCLGGAGPAGHIAFNENPDFNHVRVSDDEFLADRTRLVMVDASTVDMDALVASCGDRAAVPPFSVTVGPRDLLRSKRMEAIFFAGRFQRYALRQVMFLRPTHRFPGSLLKVRIQPDGSLTRQNITVWATEMEVGPITTQTI